MLAKWKHILAAGLFVCLFVTYVYITGWPQVHAEANRSMEGSVMNTRAADELMSSRLAEDDVTAGWEYYDTVYASALTLQTPPDSSKGLKHSSNWIGKKVANLFEKLPIRLDVSSDKLRHKQHCETCVIVRPSVLAKSSNKYDCRRLKTSPHPYTCLYPSQEDIYISRDIRRTGRWEEHIVDHVTMLLGNDRSIGLIDLGANIGVYSLAAAKLSHNVLAVEPFIENIERLYAAAQMEHSQEYVVVLHNAVSDIRGVQQLVMNSQNQGDIRLAVGNNISHLTPLQNNYGYSFINVITLDDLVPYVSFKHAVMKVDIQGHEHRIFRSADRLLNEVYVAYIFMEWILIREYYGSEVTRSVDKDLAQEMVTYLVDRGYTAYSAISRQQLPLHMWYAWPEDVYWKHELAELMLPQ